MVADKHKKGQVVIAKKKKKIYISAFDMVLSMSLL